MYADLDWDGLQRDIKDAGGSDAATTRLHGDPGATFGQLDYFKGSTFLRTIEAAVGRAKWDAYLRAYTTNLKAKYASDGTKSVAVKNANENYGTARYEKNGTLATRKPSR